MKKAARSYKVWWLVAALVLVVAGNVLLVGALTGWFGILGHEKAVIGAEYACDGEPCEDLWALSSYEYEALVKDGRSFVLFVDQDGCHTADRLRGYVKEWAKEKGTSVYRMMFSEMKGTSLGENVKFYPSVVVVSQGKVLAFLRADSDEDAAAYNNYDDFARWMGEWVE